MSYRITSIISCFQMSSYITHIFVLNLNFKLFFLFLINTVVLFSILLIYLYIGIFIYVHPVLYIKYVEFGSNVERFTLQNYRKKNILFLQTFPYLKLDKNSITKQNFSEQKTNLDDSDIFSVRSFNISSRNISDFPKQQEKVFLQFYKKKYMPN